MPRGQGRPSHSFVINFNHPLDSMGKIEALLKSEPIRENIVKFATSLLSLADIKLDANLLSFDGTYFEKQYKRNIYILCLPGK